MKNITMIDSSRIFPHPQNPRKNLGDLSELAESIRVNGIMQNLTVVPKPDGAPDEYLAVIGNRRLAASKIAGVSLLPCVISDMDHKQQVGTMLAENIQRNELTVYEQAEGFQMMLDLGESMTDIAASTGFSVNTVRSRVKLMELDRDKLAKSVKRGARLEDFAKLEKISDPELKNTVLESIGTPNFNYELKRAVSSEEAKAREEALIAELNTFAVEIDRADVDGLQHIQWVSFYGNAVFEKPADAGIRAYFYTYFSGTSISLYATPTKEYLESAAAQEEARKQQSIRGEQLTQIAARSFELRYEFIRNLTGLKALSGQISKLAVYSMLISDWYTRMNSSIVAEMLNIDFDEDEGITVDALSSVFATAPARALLVTAYAKCGDSKNATYHNRSGTYAGNDKLDGLYDMLEALGYELSDEERDYKNGTHMLFACEEQAEAA